MGAQPPPTLAQILQTDVATLQLPVACAVIQNAREQVQLWGSSAGSRSSQGRAARTLHHHRTHPAAFCTSAHNWPLIIAIEERPMWTRQLGVDVRGFIWLNWPLGSIVSMFLKVTRPAVRLPTTLTLTLTHFRALVYTGSLGDQLNDVN